MRERKLRGPTKEREDCRCCGCEVELKRRDAERGREVREAIGEFCGRRRMLGIETETTSLYAFFIYLFAWANLYV